MAQYLKQRDPMERLAILEQRLAALERGGPLERDEVPLFPTSQRSMPYDDATGFVTQWDTRFTPRTAQLALGLVLLGDQVAGTNTGGSWQVLLESAVVGSGIVPPTFSFVQPDLVIDLSPYRTADVVRMQIQTRRTSGATTGGRYGGGGSVGCAPRYAQLL